MPLKYLPNAAAVVAFAAVVASPAAAGAQSAPAATARTQAEAARATGKPTTDAPAASRVQGTAWAARQAAEAPAGAAQPPAAAGAGTAPRVVARGDLVETLRASGRFGTFLKALEVTNLTSMLKTTPNLTVFAPTDAAFAALPPGELDRLMADRPQLQKLLTHHIINARVDSSKFKGSKGPVPSVAGNPIELDGSGEVLKADDAAIVQPDVMTSNGVLQVVDRVLTPGAAALPPASGGASSSGPNATREPAAPGGGP
jgi:uncharacterized surface protein with fasciclin (FAS1) repeats